MLQRFAVLSSLIQDYLCERFEINFSDRQEGSAVSSVVYDATE